MAARKGTEGPFQNTWLFSEDAYISKCPSRKQMTLPQDLKVRELLHDFLLKLGSRLKLDGRTILAATIYLNRYYMRVPITTSKYFVVCAAISISCKLHDTYRPSDKIAMTACVLKNPGKMIDQHSSVFWQWRDQLLYREELILKYLNFELNVDLPYDFYDELKHEADEKSPNGFYVKLEEILKYALSRVELTSSLPVLVAYDTRTLFGTMVVIAVLEGQTRFKDMDSLYLPPQYLEKQIRVTVEDCYACYKYLMRLRHVCEDTKLPSHQNFVTKLAKVSKEEFFKIAGGAEKPPAEQDQDASLLDDL